MLAPNPMLDIEERRLDSRTVTKSVAVASAGKTYEEEGEIVEWIHLLELKMLSGAKPDGLNSNIIMVVVVWTTTG